MTDTELIEAARGGDREAFGALVARHQGRVYALCLRLAGNAADAEDLAHDALVEAWLKLGQLRDPAAFAGWLRTVALNVFRMWWRRRRETVALPEALPATPPDVDRERLHARLARGLFALSSTHRVVLVLHYLEGLSYEEIAALLDLPMGTVMSRMYRGRRALESALTTSGPEEKTMDPTDTITQDVLAEISVLLELYRERPEDAERLSVILERSPERLGQLLDQGPEVGVLEAVGTLLPRLGAPAVRVVLDAALDEAAPPAGAAPAAAPTAARTVLRAATARFQTLPWGGGPDATADPDAYVLADALIAHPAAPPAKVALLIDLLDAVNDTAVGELLADLLLGWPDAATEALLARYRGLSSAADLLAGKEALQGTCRLGTPFARALLEDLSAPDPARWRLALAGVETLARLLDREPDPAPPRTRVLKARHGAVVPQEAVDAGVLEALTARVVARAAPGGHAEADPAQAADVREAAIRTLGALRAGADTVRAALTDPEPTLRLAAVRATALVGDTAATEALARLAAEGAPGERAAAVEALGAVKAASAEPLLARLLDDPDRAVQVAAVSALGELGGPAAEARLRTLMAEGPVALRKAAAKALFRGGRLAQSAEGRRKASARPPHQGEWRRDGALMSRRLWDRLRGADTAPVADISIEGALRWGLPELRAYDEAELGRRVGAVCVDVSSVRRKMVEQGIMEREEGVYTFTPLGRAVWRVERFLEGA